MESSISEQASVATQSVCIEGCCGVDLDRLSDENAVLLDSVAAAESLDDWKQFFLRDEFRVPEMVLSFRLNNPVPPGEVRLRRDQESH